MVDDIEEVLLRYRYPDGTMQAAIPMRVVSDDATLVAWLPPGSSIMYWALPSGGDPRSVPANERFRHPLTTAPRTWHGNGVLRVIPNSEPFQVLHFWDDDGSFAGWYVNFEAPRSRTGNRVDSVDWYLGLWLDPDGTPTWKDEEEAEMAVASAYLDQADLDTARTAGAAILKDLDGWLRMIGDWREYVPPPEWSSPLALPDDWTM